MILFASYNERAITFERLATSGVAADRSHFTSDIHIF